MKNIDKPARPAWRWQASGLAMAAAMAPMLGFAGAASAQTADASPPAASSAGTLEEIVVTARRVTERLQDVPQAVSAINQQQLADNHIQSVYDIKYLVPNLFQSKTSTLGGGLLFIRGIVSQGLPNATLDTRVGIYVDGVYLARPEGINTGMADIAQVEVLKGPQGTLFGRNVTAGALSFTTQSPTGAFGGEVAGNLGNYKQRRFKLVVNTPESHGLSLRFAYNHDEAGGQIVNRVGGVRYGPAQLNTSDIAYSQTSNKALHRVDGHENDAFFFAAHYDGVEKLTVDYKFDYSESNENSQEIQSIGIFPSGPGCVMAGYYLGLPIDQCLGGANTQFNRQGVPVFGTSPTIGALGSYNNGVLDTSSVYLNTPLSFDKQRAKSLDFSGGALIRAKGHNLTLQYEITPDLSLKSITAYRELTANGQIDTDGQAFRANPNYFNNILFSPGDVPANAYLCGSCSYNRQESRQFSEEFQVIGKWGHVADFIGGLYYFSEHTQAQSYYSADFTPNLTYGTPAAFLPAAIQPLFPGGLPGLNAIPPLVPGQPVLLNTGGFANGEYEHFASESYAPFAHVTIHLTDKLDVAGGARYTVDRKQDHVPASVQAALVRSGLVSLGTDPRVKYKKFTWDGTVSYKVTPDINIYNRYATAYLAGGFFNSTGYVPETSWSNEIGMKSEWLDHRVRLNVAAYYQKTTNSQDTGQTQTGGIYVANLPGKLVNKGFEADATVLPIRGLSLNGSVGYAKLKYPCVDAYDETQAPLGTCFTRQQNSPEWTATVSGQYDVAEFSNGSHLSFRVEGQYQSKFDNLTYPASTPSFLIQTPAGPFIGQGQGFENLDLGGARAAIPGTPEFNYKALLTYLGYNTAVNPNSAFAQYVADLNEATKGGGYWLVNARASLVDIPISNTKGRVSAYVNNLFNKKGRTNGSNYGGYFGRNFEPYRTFGVDVSVQF
jgi:iron complex outermembrane receptor protein